MGNFMPGLGRGGPGRGGVRARPSGGFSPQLGSPDQHQDEAAMKAAVKKKQLQQQQSSTKSASGKAGTKPLVQTTTDKESGQQDKAQTTPQANKPREVKGLKEELIKRPLKDVKRGLNSLVDLRALFEVKTEDSPEEKAKKQQIHQRYQKLSEEQQQVAQRRYQEELKRKKEEREEEEEKKRQEEEAQQQQAMAPPSSPQKGPIGPAAGQSKKQKAQTQLQQQRQTLGSVGQKH